MRGVDSRTLVLERVSQEIKSAWVGDRFIDRGGKFEDYIGRPADFIEEVLGDKLTEEQKLICRRFVEDSEVNVQAAHGVGKSFLASRLAIYQTFVVKGRTITTAPTFRQVVGVLWKEIGVCYAKFKQILGGEGGKTFLRVSADSKAEATGFTARHNSTDAFQGIHAENLLVIEDEACGISADIDAGAIACAVDNTSCILRIGNPTNPNTPFAKACSGGNNIRIPVWNHPNVSWAYDPLHRLLPWVEAAIVGTDGKIKKRSEWAGALRGRKDAVPGAVSIEWIERVRRKFGEESAYWQSRVNAYFPDNVADGIIPLSWLVEARRRYDHDPQYWDNLAADSYWQLGLDVADGGGDRHALSSWGGRSVLYGVQEIIPRGDRLDTMRIAGIAVRRMRSLGQVQIAVDNLGVGAGTLSRIRELNYLAYPCTYSESPTSEPVDGIGYRNLKAQLFWELREDLEAGKVAIAPLGEEVEASLFEELSAIKYDVSSNGLIFCHSKRQVKRELGRSPDLADAVVIARSLSPLSTAVEAPIVREWWEEETEVLSEMEALDRALSISI